VIEVDVDSGSASQRFGIGKPSVDLPYHLAIYRAGAARSVIHTHSIYATALSVRGESIPSLFTGAAELFGEDVPTISFTTDQRQLEDRLVGLSQDAPACLLERHGAFIFGDSVTQALNRAEVLEAIAHTTIVALGMNSWAGIPPEVCQSLRFRYTHYYGQGNPSEGFP
jgi:L-fuculose-phosphate aldolase